MMESEAAKKDGEEHSHHFIATGLLIFGVEPRALVLCHSSGIERIGIVHSCLTSNADKNTLGLSFRSIHSCGNGSYLFHAYGLTWSRFTAEEV
jgi:hypothetical protein